jgi:hypothetical protein
VANPEGVVTVKGGVATDVGGVGGGVVVVVIVCPKVSGDIAGGVTPDTKAPLPVRSAPSATVITAVASAALTAITADNSVIWAALLREFR